MTNHITEMIEHAETNWFACPLGFTGDDNTVAGDADNFELRFSLSAWLFGGWGWDRAPPGTYALNRWPGASPHLVKNPRTTDFFKCWLGHEVVEGRADYVGIESLNVGTVLELHGHVRLVDIFDPDGNRVQFAQDLVEP